MQTAHSLLLSASGFSLPKFCLEKAKWMKSEVGNTCIHICTFMCMLYIHISVYSKKHMCSQLCVILYVAILNGAVIPFICNTAILHCLSKLRLIAQLLNGLEGIVLRVHVHVCGSDTLYPCVSTTKLMN